MLDGSQFDREESEDSGLGDSEVIMVTPLKATRNVSIQILGRADLVIVPILVRSLPMQVLMLRSIDYQVY